jgi:hypothetical protein
MFWNRPKPKYEVSSLVLLGASFDMLFMLIKERRYTYPQGNENKQWTYGGAILSRVDGTIMLKEINYVSCILETDIAILIA